MKTCILVFPPMNSAEGVHIALPSLSAQLKRAGYKSQIYDLNINFLNDLFKESTINYLVERIKKNYENIEKELSTRSINSKSIYKKYKRLKMFIENKDNIPTNISHLAEKQFNLLKTNMIFDNNKHEYAYSILKNVQQLIAMAFSPYSLSIPYSMMNYEKIKTIIKNRNQNIYINLYDKYIDKILETNPDFIGISISIDRQILGGLTLAFLLKQRSKAHISIGGNYINRIVETFKEIPDFFDTFADSILFNEGERTIVELLDYLDGKKDIKQVNNIIYKQGNIIVENPIEKPPTLSEIASPDFDGIDFSLYLSPNPIIPITLNRGCYWNKCIFCDMAYKNTYSTKPIKQAIDEIKSYIDKYEAKKFFVIDESVSPSYLDSFSDAIIENNLDIRFNIMARFEKQFNEQILKKAYNAGLRGIGWGLESANKRIQKIINKGIDINLAKKILKISSDSGITNAVSFLIGLPTETYKEAKETLDFIYENRNIIHSYSCSILSIGKHCEIAKNPNKYKSIIKPEKDINFSHIVNIKMDGLTEMEKEELFYYFQNHKELYKEILKYNNKMGIYNLLLSLEI